MGERECKADEAAGERPGRRQQSARVCRHAINIRGDAEQPGIQNRKITRGPDWDRRRGKS